MPLQETSGNLTTDAFGGGVAVVPTYIEDVFSTWLYTGNGTTQQIINGIDLSTKGGLIWTKSRSNAFSHAWFDTARGGQYMIQSNNTSAPGNQGSSVVDFNTNGYTWTSSGNPWNTNNYTNNEYVGWTFRKQPKFFTQGTYTGNGTTQAITHDLGSAPGCVIVKNTTTAGSWIVYHSGLTSGYYISLNSTAAQDNTNAARRFGNNSTTVNPTSTTITVGDLINTSGDTWVYYAFASNAGGFGLTGTDNVISCGSYVGTGAIGNFVTLGYEPQWLMVKNVTSAFDWIMYDNMRGMPASDVNTGNTKFLRPNTSGAEAGGATIIPTATGFQANTTYQGANFSGETYIYIAIRRGPMAVPTDATKVFSPNSVTTGSASVTFTPNFVVDFNIGKEQGSSGTPPTAITRLAGSSSLNTSDTSAESSNGNIAFDSNISVKSIVYNTSVSEIGWSWRRSPGFMDVVCYTGTGTATLALTHNLGVVPTMMIVKSRSNTSHWMVYVASEGNTKELQLERTNAVATNTNTWGSTTPTSTQFTVGCIVGSPDTESTNDSGYTYVAYLFATCAGVSKVGSYTGNGTTQTINCGFTGGARFVLIKRTDSTGDWYVYDTARGMTTLTDPYLLLNSTAAETATLGSVTTVSTGFALNATILAAINTNAATYIFLAIA